MARDGAGDLLNIAVILKGLEGYVRIQTSSFRQLRIMSVLSEVRQNQIHISDRSLWL